MAQLKVYQYSKCGTCRKATKWLEAHNHELELHPIFETAPSAAELATFVAQSGLALKKFFNTSGEVYKELGLKDKLASMNDEEQLALLASNGRLIKRPIVTDGTRVTVGFKEAEYTETWS